MQGVGRTIVRTLKDAEGSLARIDYILKKGHDQTHEHGGRDEVATATPAANAIPKAGATGTLASSWLPITMYNGTIVKTLWRVWNGTATTTGGVATFYPTNDGLATGTALFANVYAIQVTAVNNTAAAIGVPFAAVKALAGDKKSLTVNVVNGLNIAAVPSDTVAFAADGTSVYCTIIGD